MHLYGFCSNFLYGDRCTEALKFDFSALIQNIVINAAIHFQLMASSLCISGSKNWENKNVFGQIETITDQDYKNPGYYSIPVSQHILLLKLSGLL